MLRINSERKKKPMKKINLLVLSLCVSLILPLSAAFGLGSDMMFSTLPSGQKVVIKENHDNKIVKIDTWINTGSINEDDKTTGISHFLEHLFFKGTQKYPTGTFDKILDSKGAEVNAATSKDYTHYYIQIPSKDFDLALELHSDMLLNPMIPRKELERERPVVIEEISKTKDSPQNRMFDNLYNLIYSKSNHPYQRTVIGKKEVIQNVTREEILDYYNRFYTPDAYTTVIVGDVDKQDALKKVELAFSKKKALQEKIKYPQVKPLTKIEKIEDTMDINKTHLMIGFLAPKFSNEMETYPLDVLSSVLTSGKSSILNQKLKEEKDLVLSISSGNYSQKDSGIFYIYATLNPKNEKIAQGEILKEIENIQKGNLDDTTLQKAKKLMKTDIYYSRESISNIAEELGYDFTFSKNENYYDNYIKNIEKVSKEDVIKAARKYLNTQKYALSIVSPKEKSENIKEISSVSNKDVSNGAILLEEQETQHLKKYKLSNKATLITKNKKTNSIVAIDISILGSKMAETKPAQGLMAAALAQYGTQNYTSSNFAQFLDENGIKLGLANGNDVFSISLQATKESLDNAFIALDEVLNRALFQDSEFEKVRARKIQELKATKDSASKFVFDEFKKLAFQNTVYGQNSSYLIKALQNLKREDVVEYYKRIINPENMVISVVGDVSDDILKEKFTQIIKENEKGQAFSFKKVKYNSFKPQKNLEETFYKNELEAAWLALGFKTCPMLSDENRKDLATLSVINSILGQGMSSRLFVNLREEQGLAYTVGSTLSSNILDGAYIAYIGTNENSIQKAKEGILNQINILKKEMVTTKELNDAKNKIMGQLEMGLETNMQEADLNGWYGVLGRSLEGFEEYKKMIMDVSQSDVIEIANKYFSKPYIYTVVRAKK